MDRRTKKSDQADKIVKDRGDKQLLIDKSKRNGIVTNVTNVNNKSFLSDRGDSNRKCPEKKTVIDPKKIGLKSKSTDANVERSDNKKIQCSDKEIKPLDLEERKRIKARYTLKLRNLNQNVPSYSDKKDEGKPRNLKVEIKNVDKMFNKQLNNQNELAQDTTNGSIYSGKSIKKPEKLSLVKRKPVVKTILTKSDTMKIYKAVSFIDQNKCTPMPLQIEIPTEVAQRIVSELTDTNSLKSNKMKATVSRASIKEKPVTVRKKIGIQKCGRNRHVTSPASTGDNPSPPTEVARWAPSSINRQTKPYYEAWVNTTLAAFSRNYKNDQYYLENQNIIKAFQKALEHRAESPDLVYENCTDEKYTGKIKVKQRQSSNKFQLNN